MSTLYHAIVDFSGGELSPQMTQRIDLPEYAKGVKQMQNFYTIIQGGAKKRRGQAYVATASNSAHPVKLIPYVLNTTYTYLVIINNGTMQFAKNGNLIQSYSITCPYQDADLPLMRYAQSGSILYIFHPNYPIFSLQCGGDTNWSLAPTQFTYNATSDVDFSNAFVNSQIINGDTAFGAGTQFFVYQQNGLISSYTPLPTLPFTPAAQPVNLASDGNNFNISVGGIGTSTAPIIMDGINLQVGNYVLLKDQTVPSQNGVYLVNSGAWTRASWYNTAGEFNNSQIHVQYGLIWGNQYFNQTATITNVGTDTPVFAWALSAPGDGQMAGVTSQLGATGTYMWSYSCLTASTTGQTWQVLGIPGTASGTTVTPYTPTYISGTSFSIPGNVTSYFPTYQVLQFDDATSLNMQNPPAINSIPRGYVLSATYNGTITTVTTSMYGGQVIPSDLSQVSCIYTAMWKPGSYANAGCFYEGRMMTGGSSQFPQYIWGSRAGGYFLDFTCGLTEDMGIIEAIAGNNYNQIIHLVSSRQLLLMTTNAEYAMFGPSNQALSGISSNIIKDYTGHGTSTQVRPIRIGKEVLFVQRDGLKVRAISYEITSDSNVAPDITLFSNHLTNTGVIVDCTFAQNPDYLSWFITNDGRMLSCTFDRDQGIIAWGEHTTDGTYQAVCTVPGIAQDYTYVVVSRNINGTPTLFIELMDYTAGTANQLGGPSLADCFFIFTSNTNTNTITGLPASLYNATGISVVINGTVENGHTISNTGTITTITSGTYFVIGFPYTAQLQLLTPEFGDVGNPTLVRRKGFNRVFINVDNATDLQFNSNETDQFGNLISADVDIPFLTTSVGLGAQVVPYSGQKQVDTYGWKTTNEVWIKSTNPTDITVLGVIYKGDIGE
jgi:hypothetical protein